MKCLRKWFLTVALGSLLLSCSNSEGVAPLSEQAPAAEQGWQNRERPQGYTLKSVVVLSRHNIRSPLSGKNSVLGRITPHQWFEWTSGKAELSLRGGVLETMMGQYFKKWLVDEGLISENEIPADSAVRFYANSMQRTIATAQYFSSGLFPVANMKIEHHYDVGTMDPVFTPQFIYVSEGYREKVLRQVADIFGDGSMEKVGGGVKDSYGLLEDVLDMAKSEACLKGDTCSFSTSDVGVDITLEKEPAMRGSLKLACTAADALILQYYEDSSDSADFGHDLDLEDWKRISHIKDYYGDVLFTAPLVAVNVAHPILQELSSELRSEKRVFSFLCGHDSNIGSVLAALGVKEYSLPEAIELKTPIGGKLVIEKWQGKDGDEYAAVNLVYQTVRQLKEMSPLSLTNPPVVYPLEFEGLQANKDGLYKLSDLQEKIKGAIEEFSRLKE